MDKSPLESSLVHFGLQKKTRTDEDIHQVINVQEAVVEIHFDHTQKAFDERIPAALLEQAPVIPAIQTLFADMAFGEQCVDRTEDLVIVKSHYRGYPQVSTGMKDGRRYVVIDIVKMNDIRFFGFEHPMKFFS